MYSFNNKYLHVYKYLLIYHDCNFVKNKIHTAELNKRNLGFYFLLYIHDEEELQYYFCKHILNLLYFNIE